MYTYKKNYNQLLEMKCLSVYVELNYQMLARLKDLALLNNQLKK
jgi:hypothetical protein